MAKTRLGHRQRFWLNVLFTDEREHGGVGRTNLPADVARSLWKRDLIYVDYTTYDDGYKDFYRITRKGVLAIEGE